MILILTHILDFLFGIYLGIWLRSFSMSVDTGSDETKWDYDGIHTMTDENWEKLKDYGFPKNWGKVDGKKF